MHDRLRHPFTNYSNIRIAAVNEDRFRHAFNKHCNFVISAEDVGTVRGGLQDDDLTTAPPN